MILYVDTMKHWQKNVLSAFATIFSFCVYHVCSQVFSSQGFFGEFYGIICAVAIFIITIYLFGVYRFITTMKRPMEYVDAGNSEIDNVLSTYDDSMIGLGFQRLTPEVSSTNRQVHIVGYLDSTQTIYGWLIRLVSDDRDELCCGFTTTFHDETIELNTTQNPLCGYGDNSARRFHQVFPDSDLLALFKNHIRGRLFLKELGYRIDPQDEIDMLVIINVAEKVRRESFLRAPLRNASIALFNAMLRTKYKWKPIDKQPGVIDFLHGLSLAFSKGR